jgi:hypothetical protein
MAVGLALLVSADPATIQQFSLALRELSITPDACQDASTGLPDEGPECWTPRTLSRTFHAVPLRATASVHRTGQLPYGRWA